MFEPREGVLLTVNKPKRADPPGSTRPGETREAAFKDLRLEVNYVAAEFQGVERAELRVRIFDVRTRKPLLYQHYVFNEKQPPRNQFTHGFTGLVYVFHPESKAELWFSCSIGGQ
jgi:hypothetical protein